MRNEIISYDGYVEILLYDKLGKEKERTKIDLSDVAKVSNYRWCLKDKNYVHTDIGGKKVMLHRFLLVDRNPLNNMRKNLRFASNSLNAFNCSKYPTITGKWRARIQKNKKTIYSGLFDKKEEAKKSRIALELKYYGEVVPR